MTLRLSNETLSRTLLHHHKKFPSSWRIMSSMSTESKPDTTALPVIDCQNKPSNRTAGLTMQVILRRDLLEVS